MNEFGIRTRVYFGKGSLNKLNDIKNKKVLIVCDKFMETSGMVEKVSKELSNCEVSIFSDVVPDPAVEIIASGIFRGTAGYAPAEG